MSNENEVVVEEKKGVDGEKRFSGADEPIKSSFDLEQEKQRRAQEFYAQGNKANFQVFIQSVMGDLNMKDLQRQVFAAAQPSSEQTYQLHTPQGCAAFVEHYKNSEHLAVAIALSTFELVRLNDLNELKTLLMAELPKVESSAEDASTRVRDPYISINTYLTAVGGGWFTNQYGQQCVGLGEHSQQALKMLWEQFPDLRDPICRWLFRLCQVYKFRTAFDAYQIVCAFVRVISLDFEDAQRRVFSRLYSDGNNAAMLGNIMCKLHEDANLRREVEKMLLDWLDSESDWLWRSASLACSFLMSEQNNNLPHKDLFDSSLKKVLKRRLFSMTEGDSAFIVSLLSQSKYFRTILAGLLGNAVRHAKKQSNRLRMAQIYLFLLRSCYYLVDANYPALPLAACDNKLQQLSLAPVLREIISKIALRSQLYAIMQAYLEELSRYQCSKQLVNHLCGFFYCAAQSAPDYWPDILQFLKDCNGKPAEQIYERLYARYPLNRRLSSTTY